MSINIMILIITAVFIGALMRTVFGFGEAIVSMPLLALLPVSLNTSVSLIGLAGLTVAALTVVSGWRHIERPILIRLVISTVLGIPLGLIMLRYTPASVITTGLGIFLTAYGCYSILKKKLIKGLNRPLLTAGGWVLPFGFASGALGSAYNFNGVPVVIYGTLRHWNPERFRGTLQAHFLVSGILVVSGHALSGLWTKELLTLYAFSIPAILLAIMIGKYFNKKIPAGKFENHLYILIILLGILLLLSRK
ncbi:MAG: sulfite exporter TauE/SafE family protein [Heyndrickxia sp.]